MRLRTHGERGIPGRQRGSSTLRAQPMAQSSRAPTTGRRRATSQAASAKRGILALACAAALFAGCTDARRYDQAVAVLIDVSGTYRDARAEAVRIVKRDILPVLVPGDSLVVIRIDSESYDQDNVEAVMTLDARPSRANAQKLALARKLEAFARQEGGSAYSDIPGAMMLAAEYLRELGSGSRVMLVFSDLEEELPAGSVRRLADAEFEGIRIVAMNVKRLQPDTFDPERYRARLSDWERRAAAARAADWQTFLDAQQLPPYLESARTG